MNFFQKYFLFSFIVFGVFFPEVYSPGTSADSPPKFDGYWWQTLPPEFQLGFILGYQEGLKMALGELIARNRSFPGSSENLSPKSLEDQFRLRPQFTCGEIEKELNKIYEDKTNKGIYIYSAITIALMKLRKEPEEAIQKTIIQYRKAKDLIEKKSTSEGVANDQPH